MSVIFAGRFRFGNEFVFESWLWMGAENLWRDAGSGFWHEQTNQINFIRIKRQRFANGHSGEWYPIAMAYRKCVTVYYDVMKQFISKRFFEVSIIFHFRRLIYHTIRSTIELHERIHKFWMERNDRRRFEPNTSTHKVLSCFTLGNNQFLRLTGFNSPPFLDIKNLRT